MNEEYDPRRAEPTSSAGGASLSGSTADQVRAGMAGGLDSAAESVESGAQGLPRGGKLRSAAHGAADALASGAHYLREHNTQDMIDDLMEVVKNNPGPALFGAVALGFLMGRAFTRN
jgi:hypothetical protein